MPTTICTVILLALYTADAPEAPVTDHARGPASTSIEPWQPLFRGVDYAAAQTGRPCPLRVHAVRIDLQEPSIEFVVTPSNGELPLDTGGLRTSTFLKQNGCQVAINASPFAPFAKKEGDAQDVLGLSISRGDRYSPPVGGYGALILTREKKARIAAAPITDADLRDGFNAVGGFRLLLKDGRNVGENDKLHPRSAVGISKDGRYLYLVAIDGRQAGYSEGTTTAETAEWMRRLGAHDALNLDGGGSTALVADGPSGARVLNRPIHLGIPGMERISANHLGVKAARLK